MRQAIRIRMAEMEWGDADLAREAALSYNAVHEFLSGRRSWPQRGSRRAIERALGWATGTLDRMALGDIGRSADPAVSSSAEVVRGSTSDVRVVLDFPAEVVAGMSPLALAIARAEAEAAYLRVLSTWATGELSPD